MTNTFHSGLNKTKAHHCIICSRDLTSNISSNYVEVKAGKMAWHHRLQVVANECLWLQEMDSKAAQAFMQLWVPTEWLRLEVHANTTGQTCSGKVRDNSSEATHSGNVRGCSRSHRSQGCKSNVEFILWEVTKSSHMRPYISTVTDTMKEVYQLTKAIANPNRENTLTASELNTACRV